MFGPFGKYFAALLYRATPAGARGTHQNPVQPVVLPPAQPGEMREPPVYRVAAVMSFHGTIFKIWDRRNGRVIASVPSLAQALTLCDTLNLAAGALPSRRFLDAVHQGRDWP